MRKHFVPDASTRIDLEATAEGSRIRIFAGTRYTRGMSLANPIPYRGVSITDGQPSTGLSVPIYVMASDSVVLAQEQQTAVFDSGSSGLFTTYNTPGSSIWNGGNYVHMYTYRSSPPGYTYSHDLTFTVPEDCISPITETPPAYPGGIPAYTVVYFTYALVPPHT